MLHCYYIEPQPENPHREKDYHRYYFILEYREREKLLLSSVSHQYFVILWPVLLSDKKKMYMVYCVWWMAMVEAHSKKVMPNISNLIWIR